MEQMQDVVLIEGARTPIGRFGGSLKDISASQLGSIVIKEAISRSGIRESDVEEVTLSKLLKQDMLQERLLWLQGFQNQFLQLQ